MAFRKRSFKTRRSVRRTSQFARKRRNWSQFSIDPCAPLVVPQCERTEPSLCCTEMAKFVLLSNQELQDLYSDRCTVVRLLGDLWIQPVMGTVTGPTDIRDWFNYLTQRHSFLGLRKGEISSQDATASFDIWDDTHDDLSEGRWRKTWQFFDNTLSHFQFTQNSSIASSFDLNLPVGDVHTSTSIPGVEACSNLVSGSGSICISTDIECQACPQGIGADQINFSGVNLENVRPWHVHIDVRKRWPMRENEELYLMYNNRSYDETGGPGVDSETRIFGNVRILTEA